METQLNQIKRDKNFLENKQNLENQHQKIKI
jgi:hypothetical protein